MTVYISWSTYVLVLFLIKVSLVLFYLEIFKTRKFRIAAYTFLVYLTANSVAVFVMALCTCTPVASFWDRDIKGGTCINYQAGAYAISASSLVQDTILLILPLVFIRNLQMRRYRKVAVGCMFVVGTFGCVATLMRLPSLSTFTVSIDPSWDYVAVTIWTELELAAGFVCVSLPPIRIVFVKLLPKSVKKMFSSMATQSRSKSKSKSKNNSTPRPQLALSSEERNRGVSSSWVKVSAGSTHDLSIGRKGVESSPRSPGVRGSFFSAFWNRDRASSQPSQLSQYRSGSRRLESPTGNYGEVGIAITKPGYREEIREDKFEQVEMLSVPKKTRQPTRDSCRSFREEHITALPQIGCIPEGSYSGSSLPSTLYREKDMV